VEDGYVGCFGERSERLHRLQVQSYSVLFWAIWKDERADSPLENEPLCRRRLRVVLRIEEAILLVGLPPDVGQEEVEVERQWSPMICEIDVLVRRGYR
jgi:hypothetical protein